MAATPIFNRGEAGYPQKTASVPMSTGDTATSAGGAAVALTYDAPGAGKSNEVQGIWYSYDTSPTGGGLTITDDGNTVFSIAISGAGKGEVQFDRPRRITSNKALVITLAGGGGAVVGKINASVIAVQ